MKLDFARFSPERSLAARLAISAAAWCLIVLILAGFGLSSLYRRSVMEQLDADLESVIVGLLSAIEPADGRLALPELPNDPRFRRPLSGRYWQVATLSAKGAPDIQFRSASLWDESIAWTPVPKAKRRPGVARYYDAIGPQGARLRCASVVMRVQGLSEPLLVVVAADRAEAERSVGRFALTLAAALTVLAVALVLAVLVQVRLGLAPLEKLKDELLSVRRGKALRMSSAYPREIQPLTDELNKLLEHNRAVVERARTHVGNLAHALKTPISVMLNEARAAPGPLSELVQRQAEAMSRNVDHYLRRAQAAARAEAIGARTAVAPVLDDLTRLLERLYGRQKDLSLSVECADNLHFRGEREDLEEMIGNLMENACKYGRSHVEVRAARAGEGLMSLMVDDDGPGLSPQEQALALQRGRRLDESTPGQGLGLAIVEDVARLHGGHLRFETNPMHGLRAILTLPSAD